MPRIEWPICSEKSCRELSPSMAQFSICGAHARQLNQILPNILKNYQ